MGISSRIATRTTTPAHPARPYAWPLAVIPAVPPKRMIGLIQESFLRKEWQDFSPSGKRG